MLEKIDVFITIDGNIKYQQQFKGRRFGTIIIRSISNRFEDLTNLKSQLDIAIQESNPGKILKVP